MRTKREQAIYQAAYDQAAAEHPKGGGLMGASARLMVAQFAGDEAVRKARKDYDLLASAVACEYCGAMKG